MVLSKRNQGQSHILQDVFSKNNFRQLERIRGIVRRTEAFSKYSLLKRMMEYRPTFEKQMRIHWRMCCKNIQKSSLIFVKIRKHRNSNSKITFFYCMIEGNEV